MNILRCDCSKCGCHREFELIDHEELLNVIQHGRLNSEQIEFAKKRLGSSVCEQCFVGKHHHSK